MVTGCITVDVIAAALLETLGNNYIDRKMHYMLKLFIV